ncbi:MAG TPA: hypothetical protein VGP04_05285 [Pseudonocardiaceae bacterium]|nr:hypothetical protein [Pseudonocardiaceae bacterium]
MFVEEQRLPGGNAGGAVLVDSTVRRPTGPWTPAVHALLCHLESCNFAGGAGHRRAGPRDPELPARQDGSDPSAPGPYGCTPTKRSGKPAGGCAATTMPGPAWDDRTVVADSQASDPMGSLALLRANRPLRLLWTARTVSFLGDSLSLVALMLYVADATGAALAVALLLLVGDFAPALLVPLTGTVSDRFALKRIMLGCEAAQARWSR